MPLLPERKRLPETSLFGSFLKAWLSGFDGLLPGGMPEERANKVVGRHARRKQNRTRI